MHRLSLIVASTVLVSFGLALPASNNVIVENTLFTEQVVLTNETLTGRHPCAVDSNCECFRNGKKYKQVVVYCDKRNLTKTHQLLTADDFRVVFLDLAKNAIDQMPDMTRNGYQFVKVLVLNNNRIKSIDENSISKRLQMLILEGNQITRVDQKVINKIHASSIWWFALENNPIVCDCESAPLVKFVQQEQQKSICLGFALTTCANTKALLKNLKINELCSNATSTLSSTRENNANSSLTIKKENCTATISV